MGKITITEENSSLFRAIANCPIGTEINFSDGVVEVEKEFKDGDFLISHNTGYFTVFKKYIDACSFTAHWHKTNDNDLWFGKINFRHCTEEEKQKAIELMHSQGVHFDAEKKELVKWRWRAEKGANFYIVHSSGDIMEMKEEGLPHDNFSYSIGNYHQTVEKARVYKAKLIEDNKL